MNSGSDSIIERYITTVIEPAQLGGKIDEETDLVFPKRVASFTRNKYTRSLFLLTSVVAILTTIWHLLYVITGVVYGIEFRASHLLSMGVLFYLTTLSVDSRDWRSVGVNLVSVVFIVGLIAGNVYVFLEHELFIERTGLATTLDMIISSVLIFATLEGARRAFGNTFLALGVGALLYGMFGWILPRPFYHSGMSYTRVVTNIAIPELQGLYGFLLDLSATLIMIFVFFGVFLKYLGGVEYFGDLAIRLGSRMKSGPAQVAILSSGLMGMLSGSAVANTAATGSFTIPTMKDIGYDADYAAAIESVASTGGQIAPPIMGAAAFIIASITGVPYLQVIIAATIPAFLYYFTLGIAAHLRAHKKDMQPLDSEVASLGSLLIRSYYFVPIAIIIIELIGGSSALFAAWEGLEMLIYMFVAYKLLTGYGELRETAREIVMPLIYAFDDASRTMAPLAMLIAMIGWVIEIFQMTGVLQRITSQMIALSGGSLIILLILAASLSIVFGFGIPTSAAYLVVALIAAPPLTQLGVNVLAAHIFVFYFAILSAITLPFAPACLVASGIGNSDFYRTSYRAVVLALPIFLIPFLWIYDPALIGEGSLQTIGRALIFMLAGIVLIVSVFERYLVTPYTPIETAVGAILALGLFQPFLPVVRYASLGGTILFVLIHGREAFSSHLKWVRGTVFTR